MNKTMENFKADPRVALVCWSGAVGHQIKGRVEYVTEGKLFEELTTWASTEFPARTVYGILLLTPEVIYPISAKTN